MCAFRNKKEWCGRRALVEALIIMWSIFINKISCETYERTFGRAEARHMCFCCRLPLNGLPCTERTTSFNAFLIYYTSPSISFLPPTARHYLWQLSFPPAPHHSHRPPRQLVSASHVSEISSNWIDLSLTCISAQLPFFLSVAPHTSVGKRRHSHGDKEGGCERCKTDKRQCLLLSRKLCAMLIAHRKEINHTKLNLCGTDVHGSRRTMGCHHNLCKLTLLHLIVTWQRDFPGCWNEFRWWKGFRVSGNAFKASDCNNFVSGKLWCAVVHGIGLMSSWDEEMQGAVVDAGAVIDAGESMHSHVVSRLLKSLSTIFLQVEGFSSEFHSCTPQQHQKLFEIRRQCLMQAAKVYASEWMNSHVVSRLLKWLSTSALGVALGVQGF